MRLFVTRSCGTTEIVRAKSLSDACAIAGCHTDEATGILVDGPPGIIWVHEDEDQYPDSERDPD